MAEGKTDPKRDSIPVAAEPWPAKDYGPGGIGEGKPPMRSLDVSKDLAASDNNIPLSPQWLYAKSSDGKTALPAGPGDTRPPSSLPQGASVDSSQTEASRLEGSQDKKEWKRNVPDVDGNRRWREEERETGLLGRRERRKEGDREIEYRKNDRRPDNAPLKESADTKIPASSDRWSEVVGRTSGHESRRDSKWSSRWGPEDKEKDTRKEKKTDGDKEEPHVEKRPSTGSSDKWRPLRHRQEIHSGGSAVYRAAPGFGTDRGRVEGAKVNFAASSGRGRANLVPGLPFSRPSSSAPIGAAHSVKTELLHEKSGLTADTFRYPRANVLEIYRMNKMQLTSDGIPEGFVEAPEITKSTCMTPLAFVQPDSEEADVLDDMGKGKVVSSGAGDDSSEEKMERVTDYEIGPNIPAQICKNELSAFHNVNDPGLASTVLKDDACYKEPYALSYFEEKDGQGNMIADVGRVGLPVSLVPDNSGAINSTTSLDICAKLPDDASSLFDAPIIQKTVSCDNQHESNNPETELVELGTSSELSLCYLDPQGDVQGPFLAEDIFTWYSEGFFGIDLPVRLADAPVDTQFQPLGDVIPELSQKPQSSPLISSDVQSHRSDSRGNLEAIAPTSEISKFTSFGSEDPFLRQGQPRMPDSEVSTTSHYDKSQVFNSDTLGGRFDIGSRSFHNFSGQDSEEVMNAGRPVNSLQNPFEKLANEIPDLSGSQSAHPFLLSERGQAIPANEVRDMSGTQNAHQFLLSERGQAIPANEIRDLSVTQSAHQFLLERGQAIPANQKAPMDNDVNPLGLSWSELKGTHLKAPLSSNVAGVGDRGHIISPFVGVDASRFGHKEDVFSREGEQVTQDAWLGNFRNTSSNIPGDASRLTDLVPEPNRFNEHLLSQHFQNQQLQHHHNPLVAGDGTRFRHRGDTFNVEGDLSTHDAWLSNFRRNASSNTLQDASQLTRLVPEASRFNLQEHLLSQQFQNQDLQQQRLPSPHQNMHLAGQYLEQLQGSLQQQQSVNQAVDMDCLRKLQFQQQQHLRQLEQQQQQQQQQQQIRHRMQLLQEQHQRQQQQLRLEQMLHQQHNPSLGVAHADQLRGDATIDQHFYRQRLRHELQQQAPHLPKDRPSLDQLIKAKFGTNIHPDQYNELLNALTHPGNRHMLSLEEQLLLGAQQEQLQSRQFPNVPRQQSGMEHVGGVWSVDESGQFLRAAASPHQTHSGNLGHLDFVQTLERPSSFEQPHYLDRNFLMHDRMQRENYGLNSQNIERSTSNPRPNMDVLESLGHVNPAAQMGQFHSGSRSQQNWTQNQFNTTQMDAMERNWSGTVGQLPSGLTESQYAQFQLALEKQKRDIQVDLSIEDPNQWSSHVGKEYSNHGLADLHHEKLAFHSSQKLGSTDDMSSLFTRMGQMPQEQLANLNFEGQMDTFETIGRLPLRTSSGALAERNQFFLDTRGNESQQHEDSKRVASITYLGTSEGGVEQAEGSAIAKGYVGPASKGYGGGSSLFNFDRGADTARADEMLNDRKSAMLARGSDNSQLRPREQHQVALAEQVPVPPLKGNTSEGKKDGKDARVSRTSSVSDVEAPEASFIDMLKGTSRKNALETESSAGPAESLDGGRSSSKKKGKKGRQIDPSLLGFKVHSNRILMGEIQRPED